MRLRNPRRRKDPSLPATHDLESQNEPIRATVCLGLPPADVPSHQGAAQTFATLPAKSPAHAGNMADELQTKRSPGSGLSKFGFKSSEDLTRALPERLFPYCPERRLQRVPVLRQHKFASFGGFNPEGLQSQKGSIRQIVSRLRLRAFFTDDSGAANLSGSSRRQAFSASA